MAGYGYSYVTAKGFVAFAHDLSEGAWKDISIKDYDAPDQIPTALLFEAPRPIVWKARASWAIARVLGALNAPSSEVLGTLDTEWDSAQRALNLFLGAAAEHSDPAHRDAALRLRPLLLAGAGAEQVKFDYDKEVDFGRSQIKMASEESVAADVKKVGAGAHLKRIEKATETFAAALGRGPGQKRASAPSKRLREAVSACSSAFNAIHDEMSWFLEHTPSGDARKQIEAQHAPFLALLDRNPPAAGAPAGTDTGVDQEDETAGETDPPK
jgi:hypothetical protein